MAGVGCEGQCGDSVVWYAHLLPGLVVELAGVGPFVMDGVGFRQVIEVFSAAPEVLRGVGCVAEGETPTFIESDGLPLALAMEGEH